MWQSLVMCEEVLVMGEGVLSQSRAADQQSDSDDGFRRVCSEAMSSPTGDLAGLSQKGARRGEAHAIFAG